MTDDEKRMVDELSKCVFLPGSYEKRFVRELAYRGIKYELTAKQCAFLAKLHHSYRRQIAAHRGIP